MSEPSPQGAPTSDPLDVLPPPPPPIDPCPDI